MWLHFEMFWKIPPHPSWLMVLWDFHHPVKTRLQSFSSYSKMKVNIFPEEKKDAKSLCVTYAPYLLKGPSTGQNVQFLAEIPVRKQKWQDPPGEQRVNAGTAGRETMDAYFSGSLFPCVNFTTMTHLDVKENPQVFSKVLRITLF